MKSVWYQKRKHKKSKWMATGILNYINTKDRLYKTLLKTDTSSNAYRVAKANFKRYREILCNPTEFIWNDQIITDLDENANKFNTYFINIGHSLSEQIHATRSSDEYLSNRTNTMFNFIEVSEEFIDVIIKNMKSKSSTGYDNISNKLVISANDVRIKPLTLLMNQIIHTGKFPKQLKISKVKPLFKKGNQSSFTNYRPIHCCPLFLKLLSM